MFIQIRNWNIRYFNFVIQTNYLENKGNLITSNSSTMHFNFLTLFKCFIETQGKLHYGWSKLRTTYGSTNFRSLGFYGLINQPSENHHQCQCYWNHHRSKRDYNIKLIINYFHNNFKMWRNKKHRCASTLLPIT